MAKLILAIDMVEMKKATIMLNPTPTILFLHSHAPPLVKVIEGVLHHSAFTLTRPKWERPIRA